MEEDIILLRDQIIVSCEPGTGTIDGYQSDYSFESFFYLPNTCALGQPQSPVSIGKL